MNISKKLFLMAAIVFGLQSASASAYYYEDTKRDQVFSFALDLQQQNNADAITAGKWLENELLNNKGYSHYIDAVIMVLNNVQLTIEAKIAYILELKKDQIMQMAKDIIAQKEQDKAYEQRQTERLKETVMAVAAIFTTMALAIPIVECGAVIGRDIGHHIGPKVVARLFGA